LGPPLSDAEAGASKPPATTGSRDEDDAAGPAEAPAAARVAETPFAELLLAHHAAGTTGTLRARRGPVDKRVVLERGVPVDCRSNLAHETLSRYLVALGRLREEDANAALAESAWRGVLLGRVLVERGLVDGAELTRILQQNLAKKLLDLFTWPDGEVAVTAGAAESLSALKIKVPQLVLTGVTRFMPQIAVDRALAPRVDVALRRASGAEPILAELRLGAREMAVLAALEPARTLEQVAAATGLEAADAARSLYALSLLQLAVPERSGEPAVSAAPEPRSAGAPAAGAAPAAPAAPPAAPASATPVPTASATAAPAPSVPAPPDEATAQARAALLNRVSSLFLDHRHKDAFDLLGLAEESPTAELESRFLSFARELAPWRFEEPGLRLVADYARELFLAGVRAYAELADDARRNELALRRRLAREERERERRAAHHHIDTDLLDPALQFKKGMVLLEAGKLKPALQQLEFAADCDPQNGRYRAEVARCRFALSPTTGGRQALEELREAERVDPSAVELFLYHGEIAAELARWEEAETAYRQAAKLLGPEDRRALDALRDLAQKRKKKR
jgi:hypothetical protein